MSNALSFYLESADAAAPIMAHARLLGRLNRQFAAAMPLALAQASRVANYKSGKVVIHADNSAVAAKIRQMRERILTACCQGGPECNELEVKVQPRHFDQIHARPAERALSTIARQSLADTARSLPEGPLRAAIAELLRRSGS